MNTATHPLQSTSFNEAIETVSANKIYEFKTTFLKHTHLLDVLKDVRKLISKNTSVIFQQRSLSVLIELLQNMMQHGIQHLDSNIELGFNDGKLYIHTENYMQGDYSQMHQLIEKFNSMKRSSLRTLYKTVIKGTSPVTLGLLLIARRTQAPIQYNISTGKNNDYKVSLCVQLST